MNMAQKIVHEVPAQHLLAAVLQSDSILGQVQRELYRLLPGVNNAQLRQMLRDEILQRDLIEGPQAQEAEALLGRMAQLRQRGLTTTQTMQAVTGELPGDNEEDAFHIMREDKRASGGGG